MKKINKKGLTLIELLAVIAIIAILFVLLIPQINSAIEKARVAGVQTDLHSYEIAITSHLMHNGDAMPTDAADINEHLDTALQFDVAGTGGVFTAPDEESPWGTPYVLTITTDSVKVSTEDKNEDEYAVVYTIDADSEEVVKSYIEDGVAK